MQSSEDDNDAFFPQPLSDFSILVAVYPPCSIQEMQTHTLGSRVKIHVATDALVKNALKRFLVFKRHTPTTPHIPIYHPFWFILIFSLAYFWLFGWATPFGVHCTTSSENQNTFRFINCSQIDASKSGDAMNCFTTSPTCQIHSVAESILFEKVRSTNQILLHILQQIEVDYMSERNCARSIFIFCTTFALPL